MNITKITPDKHYIENYRQLISNHPGMMEGFSQFNEDWWISPQGDMNHVSDYCINAYRLGEDDWILHLMEKSWFDANTFLPAYFEACRRAEIKTVEIRVRY